MSRANIFPHFFNRDSREIAGLFLHQRAPDHRYWLKSGLNACTIFCEDSCVLPLGFALECDIAFSILEEQVDFLRSGLVTIPIPDKSIDLTIEKKRSEYFLEKIDYSGLYNDARVDFLIAAQSTLTEKKFSSGAGIRKAFEGAPDSPKRMWTPIKRALGTKGMADVSGIPGQLLDDGRAATWRGIEKRLSDEMISAARPIRNALQNTYFNGYIKQNKLNIVRRVPYMSHDFLIKTKNNHYDYIKLSKAMQALSLDDILERGSANTILGLRKLPPFITFTDQVVQLCGSSKSDTDILFLYGSAASASKFDWRAARLNRDALLIKDLPETLSEIADALHEVNDWIGRNVAFDWAARDFSPQRMAASPAMQDVDHRVTRFESIVVVAAQQELKYVREFLAVDEALKVEIDGVTGSEIGDLISVGGSAKPFGLFLAQSKGKAAMKDLLEYVCRSFSPKRVYLVGMMGGFRNKCRILDVVTPKVVYDISIGTKAGALSSEPAPLTQSATIRSQISRRIWTNQYANSSLPARTLISHKNTLCVPAKWDSLDSELCERARAVDPENTVGIEMEGAALGERSNSQVFFSSQTEFVMFKGVADYAGETITPEEVAELAHLPGFPTPKGSVDPIADPAVRAYLQREATNRAMAYVLEILTS